MKTQYLPTPLEEDMLTALKQNGGAIIVKASGEIEPFTFAGTVPTLKELQSAVHGLIQPILNIKLGSLFGAELVMIVDEEGLLKENQQRNRHACTQWHHGPIIGDVIVMRDELFE